MDIDTLKAGRELDAMVATRLFGWAECMGFEEGWAIRPNGDFHPTKRYSTDWSAAGEVIDKLGVPNDSFCLDFGMNKWVCYFGDDIWAEASTAQLAICRAALKEAVRYSEKKSDGVGPGSVPSHTTQAAARGQSRFKRLAPSRRRPGTLT